MKWIPIRYLNCWTFSGQIIHEILKSDNIFTAVRFFTKKNLLQQAQAHKDLLKQQLIIFIYVMPQWGGEQPLFDKNLIPLIISYWHDRPSLKRPQKPPFHGEVSKPEAYPELMKFRQKVCLEPVRYFDLGRFYENHDQMANAI